jgi:hypothetical protein
MCHDYVTLVNAAAAAASCKLLPIPSGLSAGRVDKFQGFVTCFHWNNIGPWHVLNFLTVLNAV